MHNYAVEIKKYTPEVNEAALAAIEKYLEIAMRNPDSSLVSATDPKKSQRCVTASQPRSSGSRPTPLTQESKRWPRR